MALYMFEGLQLKVSMASIADFAVYGETMAKQITKAMIICGGFASSKVTVELVESLKAPMFTDADREEVAAIGMNPYIMVLKDVWDKMPEDQRLAVLLHEEGHVVNGDLDDINEAELIAIDPATKTRFIDSVDKELKADQYAAMRVGKDVMRAALVSALQIQSEMFAERSNGRLVAFDLYIDILNDPNIKARLIALN